MSFCPNCGNELPENSRFCSVCGTPVQAQNPQPVYQQQPPYAPTVQYAQPQFNVPNREQAFVSEVNNLSTHSTIIGVICGLMFAVAYVLFFILYFKLFNWSMLKESNDWRNLEQFVVESKTILDTAHSLLYIGIVLITTQFAISTVFGLMSTRKIQELAPQQSLNLAQCAHYRLTTRPSKLNSFPISRDFVLFSIVSYALSRENPLTHKKQIAIGICSMFLKLIFYILFFIWGVTNVESFIETTLVGIREYSWDWSLLIFSSFFLIGSFVINLIGNTRHINACQKWLDERVPKTFT